MRDLRRALGYERWNLLAISYGVPLARAVMRLDPEATRGAILAIGPGPVPTELLRMDIPFFARALERVFHGCAAEPFCRETFPDLEEDFYRVWASLKKEPLRAQVDPETGTSPAEESAVEDAAQPRDEEIEGRVHEGAFRSEALRSTWTLVARDGELVATHRRGDDHVLTPVSPDRFRGPWLMRDLEFLQDSDGKVTALSISQERVRDERFERLPEP